MDIQTIIVIFIIGAAVFYAGVQGRQKIKAFQPKNKSCGTDCGCESRVK